MAELTSTEATVGIITPSRLVVLQRAKKRGEFPKANAVTVLARNTYRHACRRYHSHKPFILVPTALFEGTILAKACAAVATVRSEAITYDSIIDDIL